MHTDVYTYEYTLYARVYTLCQHITKFSKVCSLPILLHSMSTSWLLEICVPGAWQFSNSQGKQFRRNVNKFSKNQLSTKFTMYICNRSDFWEILLSVAEAMQMEAGKCFSLARQLSTKITTRIVYVCSYLYSSAKTCEGFLGNLYVFVCMYI